MFKRNFKAEAVPLFTLPNNTWAFHDHMGDGYYESRPSMQIIHTSRKLRVQCYSCSYRGTCVPVKDEPSYEFREEDVVHIDESNTFIADVAKILHDRIPSEVPPPCLYPHDASTHGINWLYFKRSTNNHSHLFVLEAPKGSGKTHELSR